MFLNSFYTIISSASTPGTIVSEIKINAQHPIFEGHFPDAPVTPGVLQMQMVKEILGAHLKKDLAMKTMRTCKFLEVLDPRKNPNLHIHIQYKSDDLIDVVASGEEDGKVFFKMQASYL